MTSRSLFVGILAIVVCQAAADIPPPVLHDELISGRIVPIGALGVPLGTVVTAEVEVVRAPAVFGAKLADGRFAEYYFLRLHAVNGAPLEKKSELPFVLHLPSSDDLFEIPGPPATPGPPSESPVSALIAQSPLEQDYVGSRHTVLVHEAAEFAGRPTDLPREAGAPYLGGEGHFGYRPRLVVHLEDLRSKLASRLWQKRETLVGIASEPYPNDPLEAERWLETWADGQRRMRAATTDPASASELSRRILLDEAREQGLQAEALERCLDSIMERARGEMEDVIVPTSAWEMTCGEDVVWLVTWQHLRACALQPEGPYKFPTYGTVEWATCIRGEATAVRASDAAIIASRSVP